MDSINRLSSPMALYKEDFTQPPLEQEKRRESIKKAVQSFQAPFLIGSLERVSHKVTSLDEEIKAFCTHDLIIESPEFNGMVSAYGHQTPNYKVTGSSILKKSEQWKEQERKNLQRFSQEFQISMRNIKSPLYQQSHRSTKKKASPKPKLVELCQFPGCLERSIIPLPNETDLSTIIGNVVTSHKKKGGMIFSSRRLWKTFNTPVVQEIMLDCFWWIFLHKYKPDAELQRKLFDRIAQNYIRLLDLCQKLSYGNTFLNIFPSSLSRAIYSSFCFSFPQSLHQFQSDDFRIQLCNVLWQWFGGICPTLGSYNSWDYDTLEPKDDISHRKENQKKDLYLSKESASIPNSYTLKHKKYSEQKSHQTFCEPDIKYMAFNLNGHSPLVHYYLKKKNSESQAGINILVRRTELQKQKQD